VIGARRAMEMTLLNRTLTAQEALDWGLVNEVVPDAQVLPKSMELAGGWRRRHAAFGRTKRLIAESLGRSSGRCPRERDHRRAGRRKEGLKAQAFLEKRKPDFSG